MQINQTEVRRQVYESRVANDEAIGAWRRLLHRLFSGEGHDRLGQSAKANLLGVPDRRSFFKIGGATLAGAAVLAACSSDGSNDGASATTTGATPTTAADGEDTDLVILRTGTSLEILSVDVYNQALELDVVTTPAIIDAAKMFADQHDQHAKLLQAATEDLGGEAWDGTNDYVMTNVVEPALPDLQSEEDVVKFARELENMAAATYTAATGLLSTPDLRQAAMSIGGVEARHVVVFNTVLQDADPTTWAPDAFEDTADAAPEEANVPAA